LQNPSVVLERVFAKMLLAFKIVNFKGILNFECSAISYFVSLPKILNIEQYEYTKN